MLTGTTPEDKIDTAHCQHLPIYYEFLHFEREIEMCETQRENELERGDVGGREKKRRDTGPFILPTDIMPQKQFHNLICMGLF